MTESVGLQGRFDSLPSDENWAVGAVNAMMAYALELGFSDLHLAAYADQLDVRGRRAGDLEKLAAIPLSQIETVTARLKILARLPAYVRGEPQDGRIDWGDSVPKKIIRASFLPTIHGENVVLRFPRESAVPETLSQLGMESHMVSQVESILGQREGTVLLTGPSGSGKTTTIYAMLRSLNERFPDRLNFLTIEDPVERELGFASQVQVKEEQNLSFASALRAGLRHDPNVLMIGEIRDRETAQIAVQAGMTGHLVLSTIHAGHAWRVVSRLLSMDIEPFLIASAVTASIAQRLVRTQDDLPRRLGVFELGIHDESVRDAILERRPGKEISESIIPNPDERLEAKARKLYEEEKISRDELMFVFGVQ